MSATTMAPSRPTLVGLSTAELEALAASMSVNIETHDKLPDDRYGDRSPRTRTIRLSSGLGSTQRRCTLAFLIAHARLGDTKMNGHTDAEAYSMAFQFLVPAPERDAVVRVWEESRDHDPHRVFREYGLDRRMVAAYSELAHAWHPGGCIGWDGLCGSGDEDDIHSFAPIHQSVSDAGVMVSQSLTGNPGGDLPLEVGVSIDLDLPIVRNNMGSFHATPQQVRDLAAFLTEQADSAEAGAAQHLNGERSSAPTAGRLPALAGGGAR